MDEEYRRLERLAATGDLDTQVEFLLAQIRRGIISYNQGIAMSVFKHPVARLAFPNAILSQMQPQDARDLEVIYTVYARWIIAIIDHLNNSISGWDIATTLNCARRLFYNLPINEYQILNGFVHSFPLHVYHYDPQNVLQNSISLNPPAIYLMPGFPPDSHIQPTPLWPEPLLPAQVLINVCNFLFLYVMTRYKHPEPFSMAQAGAGFGDLGNIVMEDYLRRTHYLTLIEVITSFKNIVDKLCFVEDVFHPEIVRAVREYISAPI